MNGSAMPVECSLSSDSEANNAKPARVLEKIVQVLPDDYRDLRAHLVRAVRRVCPAWLSQDADDLVQESLIRVLQRQRRGEQAIEMSSAYLKKVAYSAVIDEIRRRRRRVEAGERSELPVEAIESGTDQFGAAAIGEGIRLCLEQQNADRRRALTLYLLGNSIDATARLLQSTQKRAENLIYRGLQHLRECLTEQGFTV